MFAILYDNETIFPVSGCEAAYEAFQCACRLADMCGGVSVELWDWDTKELIDIYNKEKEK